MNEVKRCVLCVRFSVLVLLSQLNLTHDPIADMINAVCSDIVSFASQRT